MTGTATLRVRAGRYAFAHAESAYSLAVQHRKSPLSRKSQLSHSVRIPLRSSGGIETRSDLPAGVPTLQELERARARNCSRASAFPRLHGGMLASNCNHTSCDLLASRFLNSGELSLQLVTVLHSLRPMARRGFPCRHLVLLYARPWWNSARERQELGSSLESPVWQRLPHGSSPGAYGGA